MLDGPVNTPEIVVMKRIHDGTVCVKMGHSDPKDNHVAARTPSKVEESRC